MPADVLPAKQGSKPLAAHLRRHEGTLEEEKKRRGFKGLRVPGTQLRPKKGKGIGVDAAKTAAARKRRPTAKRTVRCWGARARNSRAPPRNSRQRGPSASVARADSDAPSPPGPAGSSTEEKVMFRCHARCGAIEAAACRPVRSTDLMNEGVMVTINAMINPDMTPIAAAKLGINVEFKQWVSLEDQLLAEVQLQEDDPADLVEKACP